MRWLRLRFLMWCWSRIGGGRGRRGSAGKLLFERGFSVFVFVFVFCFLLLLLLLLLGTCLRLRGGGGSGSPRFCAGIRELLACFTRRPCAGRHLLFFAAAKKSRQKKAAQTASS